MADTLRHFMLMTAPQKLVCVVIGAIVVYILMIAMEYCRGRRSGWSNYTGLYDTKVSVGRADPGAQDTIRVSPI